MGSGEKLTEIAQRGDNPYRDVTFRTSWDNRALEPPDGPEWHDTKALFAEWDADYAAAKDRDQGTPSVQVLFEQILHGTPDVKPQESIEMEMQSPKDAERER